MAPSSSAFKSAGSLMSAPSTVWRVARLMHLAMEPPMRPRPTTAMFMLPPPHIDPAHIAHGGGDFLERLGRQRLRAVGLGVGRVVVHLDHQPIRARGHRRQRHGAHQRGNAGRVAGIDHDGQVREAVQHRHRREVERIARGRLKGTDAAFAEDDIGLPPAMMYSALMRSS